MRLTCQGHAHTSRTVKVAHLPLFKCDLRAATMNDFRDSDNCKDVCIREVLVFTTVRCSFILSVLPFSSLSPAHRDPLNHCRCSGLPHPRPEPQSPVRLPPKLLHPEREHTPLLRCH